MKKVRRQAAIFCIRFSGGQRLALFRRLCYIGSGGERTMKNLLGFFLAVFILVSPALAAGGNTVVYITRTGECYHTGLLPVSQKKQDRNNACGRRRARLPRLQGVLSAESGRRGAGGACLRGERTGGQYAVSVSVGFPDADSRHQRLPYPDTGSNAGAGPCGQGIWRGKRAVLGRRRCGRCGGRLHAFRRCQTPVWQGGEKVIKGNKMAGCRRIRPFL